MDRTWAARTCRAPWLTLRLELPRAGRSMPFRILEVGIDRKAPAGLMQADIVVTTASGKRLNVPVTAYAVPRAAP